MNLEITPLQLREIGAEYPEEALEHPLLPLFLLEDPCLIDFVQLWQNEARRLRLEQTGMLHSVTGLGARGHIVFSGEGEDLMQDIKMAGGEEDLIPDLIVHAQFFRGKIDWIWSRSWFAGPWNERMDRQRHYFPKSHRPLARWEI